MQNPSRPVSSNQSAHHPKLFETVNKHLRSKFMRPYAKHTIAAFTELEKHIETQGKPLIFDSYCGTGQSTAILAARHPDCLVVGIDQSRTRLSKHQPQNLDNYLLVRADTDDFWRLALDAGWQLQHHYIFYPNPWPKSSHLQRRIHGSPLFPTLLGLGGKLEVRSNWQVYLEELGMALAHAGIAACISKSSSEHSETLFEKKYKNSGQSLWKIHAAL
jgi:tRNA (guanine-N7-)-methyltransferase